MDDGEYSEFTNPASSISSEKQWNSEINVCPGSTPTLVTTATPSQDSIQEEELEEQKEESKVVSSLSSNEIDNLIDWESDSTWPDLLDFSSAWGTYTLEECPWNKRDKPYATFRAYRDLTLNETENKGVLTDRIIAACSSYLDRSPETGKYVLCKVDLSKKLLLDIGILTFHHYLQYVDLSWNELSDVQVLGQLPFLMYLDVSHNFLTEVLNFKPPFNLTFVNYSNNAIRRIANLSKFWSIVHLDLSHNRIKVIEGLQELKFLRHLNLSHNIIECIENLNCMKLQTLDLQHNSIVRFEEGLNVGFKTLVDVLCIDVSYNYLTTLKLFEEIPGIQSINAVANAIDDLMEITYLQDLNFLTEVDFRENPIVNMKNYVGVCLHTIKYLYVLDGEIMDAERKVLEKNNFDPSPCAEAIKTSSHILFLQQINDPVLGQAILSADHSPPPIMVLVGPPGSGKASLLHSFYKKNKKFAILGVSHTTREKTNEEVDDESYYFVTAHKFRSMAHKGEFLTVSQTLGHFFGLAQTEMAKTVGKSAVLLLHMDMTGALTLRAKGLQCRFVLAMPSTTEAHRKQLLEKYFNQKENSRYLGAEQVVNCPAKAKEFLNDNQSRPSATSMANEIVSELLHTVTTTSSTEGDDAIDMSSLQSFRADETSLDSGKIWVSSSRTSGILKTPSRQKGIDAQLPRASVTFQVDEVTRTSQVLKIVPSRSVTFNCNRPTSYDGFENTTCSISGTLIRNVDDHGLLSVLSRSEVDAKQEGSAEENLKIWSFQTKALKEVVDEILNSRTAYLTTHHSNPGLFSEVIFTDKVDDSYKKLRLLLKECILYQKNTRPYCEFRKDSLYDVMVATRLKSLHEEIDSQLSISQKQKTSIPESTLSKPLESVLKPSATKLVETMRQKHQEATSYQLPKESSFIRQQSFCELASDTNYKLEDDANLI